MSRPTYPLVVSALFGAALLAITLWLVPAETDLWRKVLVGILSITLGYHLVTAMISPPAKGRHWLECLAFPLMMLGFLNVPNTMGWVLLAAGFFWRVLLQRFL